MSLRVATFNIRCGVADDGADSWPNRRDLALRVIVEMGADVLALQEAYDYQVEAVRDALPGHGWFGVGREDGVAEGEHCSVFFRTERLELLESGTFWFSDSPNVPGSIGWGNHITRICTWGRFRDHAGHEFGVFNSHLDHESQPSRQRSAELLVRRAGVTGPAILLGDFNAEDGSAEMETILRAGYRSAYREIDGEQAAATYHGFAGGSSGERIDHVFLSREWTPTRAEIIRTSEGGRYPSDHYPLLVEASWT